MIKVNNSKLIIVAYMSHYLVILILKFLPARLATLPNGLDSNVTQLLANLLTKPSVFYYLPIVSCNLVSIKLLLLLLLLLLSSSADQFCQPARFSKQNCCKPFGGWQDRRRSTWTLGRHLACGLKIQCSIKRL